MKIRKRTAPANFGLSDHLAAGAMETAPASPAPAEPLVEAQQVAPLDPPLIGAAVAPHEPRAPIRRPEAEPIATVRDEHAAPSAWPVYLTALGVSVLWAVAPIAFAIGYRNSVAPLTNDSFALLVFALLAIGPAAFVWAAAYMIRQGQKLAAETRRAKAMAEDMLSPALVAAARAGHVVQGVREEIVRAGAAADEARDTLLALRQAVAEETGRLTDATSISVRTAEGLSGALSRERVEMGQLAETLDAQAMRVADAIGQQARMVAEAAEVADAQLREAEATLSARAADLAAAAGEAGDAARTAGEDLVRHISRLETAGVGVSEQVRAVEGGLSEQRAALITLAHALRADHEGFSTQADAHAARLSEFITQARLSAVEMSDRATQGGDALRQMMAEAVEQFRDLAETARAEREEFGQSTLQSLDAVSQAASQQRAQLEAQTRVAIDALGRAAEQTREAASRHAATAREQVEQLSEAAFAAGQKANQVFEARLDEARALVEQSSSMVEQAGAATARKLEEGAASARATLEELQTMLADLEQRARTLPTTARGQADQVRATVMNGMDELMVHARRTADEAQAIDAAFQERVRRNFEMLGEAVRLMGAVAAVAPAQAAPQAVAAPASKPAPARPTYSAGFTSAIRPAVDARPLTLEPDETDLELDEPIAMDPAPQPDSEAPLAERLGLRPRLKLTPTATDEEFSQIFEAAGGPPVAETAPSEAAAPDDEDEEPLSEEETWTWKDLLASIDVGGDRLEATLSAELAKMGIEPAKLLPKGRIDQIAAAVQTGDLDGAREVVRRLAPAATRRIVRRLFTDEELRLQVATYVGPYQKLVDDAAVRDPEGFLMASLLGGDEGRLFLLLDAAGGDKV
jgi:hypothetical protein